MKRLIILYAAVTFGLFSGCSEDFLDINENPNFPSDASLDLLLPRIQTSMAFNLSRVSNENTMIFSNMMYSLAESQYNTTAADYNNDFNGLYSDVLADTYVIVEQGQQEESYGYVGIGKIINAYVFGLMVDMWDDLPHSEAFRDFENLTPQVDNAAQIYDSLLVQLDGAIQDLQRDEIPDVLNDLIYNGDLDLWIKAANTIKLRLLLNLRLVDEDRSRNAIASLASDPDQLIAANNEDFEFRFGSSTAPENRHPLHVQEYTQDQKFFYMSNYFMLKMLSKNDPRINYYIYRQNDGSDLDFQTTPCSSRPDCPIGYLGDINPAWAGYIGRDHGDPSGLPGDQEIRSTFGVYPIGGAYDDGSFASVTDSDAPIGESTEAGAGVASYLTYSTTLFMLAEAALELGTPGDAEQLMADAIDANMMDVSLFAQQIDSDYPAIDTSDISAYIDSRRTTYQSASTQAQRLNIIIEEKYFAQFGNGWEVFTDLRRTGSPNDRPASIAPSAPFPFRLPYGLQEQVTNPNIVQVSQDTRVFWDAN